MKKSQFTIRELYVTLKLKDQEFFYKGEKISFLKNRLCLFCNQSFDLSDVDLDLFFIDLKCPYCKSHELKWSIDISKDIIDGKSTDEIMQGINERELILRKKDYMVSITNSANLQFKYIEHLAFFFWTKTGNIYREIIVK